MPNLNWSSLSPLQLGRYAEYYAKMEFASYGFDIYTSEVDDHGIDFVMEDNNGGFLQIQVKSIRAKGYVFVQKTKFDINNKNLYLALLIFNDGKLPEMFLIPTSAWKTATKVFTDKNYDKPGQKSLPEYGINISDKGMSELEKYKLENTLGQLNCSFKN